MNNRQKETQKQELIRKIQDQQINATQAKSVYKKVIKDNEKDRYHVLLLENKVNDNEILVKAQINIFTAEDWEDFTGIDGKIIKKGMNKGVSVINAGKPHILWNPRSDNKKKPIEPTPPINEKIG